MRKQHAIHNENACQFLLESGRFNDWVITTAFYSALHFVQHEIFPFQENGETYDDLNSYFKHLLSSKSKSSNKHRTTIDLVKKFIPSCSMYYRWLHDKCMSARYKNYQVSDRSASTAREYLRLLRSHLEK